MTQYEKELKAWTKANKDAKIYMEKMIKENTRFSMLLNRLEKWMDRQEKGVRLKGSDLKMALKRNIK